MSCDNCVTHVTNAIQNSPGTSNVKVDLALGKASFDYDPTLITIPELITAIEDEGYDAKPLPGA